jgi:hypothetical protein
MTPASLLALALATIDPCSAPPPVGDPGDVSAAAVYRDVGDAERAAGALDTAAHAYRRALEADPADGGARAALSAVCAERAKRGARVEDPFLDGVSRMEAGDCRGAAALFAQARARAEDASAALLEGICRYDLGEDAAERLLVTAESAPEHRDTARLYLGLLALRRGATTDAAARFESVSGNAALAPLAADLARAARRDGRLVLAVTAESGWDSNVNLGPGLPAGPEAESDAVVALAASALWRPRGQQGPYLRAAGSLREQTQLGAYDLGGADAAAGWQWVGRRAWLVAEYDFGYRSLAGDSFLAAHRALASGAVGLGRWAMGAVAFARHDDYAGVYDPFTGWIAGGELRATRALASRVRVTAAYGIARVGARTSILTHVEQGPRVELRVDVSRAVRLAAAAAWSVRSYDAFDAVLAARRSDTYLDASLLGEWDLATRWTARLTLAARRADSNVSAFDYSKLAPTVGISYVLGL